MEYEHSQQIEASFRNCAEDVSRTWRQPHVYMRPTIMPDGDKWVALYGSNIQEGVAASGDTPQQAAQNWDLAWFNQPPQMK